MAEEVRFFLRTALYATVIAVVYWFASGAYEGLPLEYDWAGTTLLAFTALACAAVTSIVLLFAREARRGPAAGEGSSPRRLVAALNRLLGLEHGPAGRSEGPLAGGPDQLPTASPWPIIVAIGATLMLLGLIYGPWLVAPGAVLLVIGAGAWLRPE